jgi:amidase
MLAVAGPLARTAQDLETALDVLGGPEAPDSIAYTWRLPKARYEPLREFRIGYALDDPLMPISSEIRPALESAVRAFEKAGARMQPGWPSGFSLQEMFSAYLVMLTERRKR